MQTEYKCNLYVIYFQYEKYYPSHGNAMANENNATEAKRHNIKHNKLFTYK